MMRLCATPTALIRRRSWWGRRCVMRCRRMLPQHRQQMTGSYAVSFAYEGLEERAPRWRFESFPRGAQPYMAAEVATASCTRRARRIADVNCQRGATVEI